MWTGSAMTAPMSGSRPATRLNAIDPASGKTVRALDVAAHAGTAFDGRHLFQIAGDRIQKVDPGDRPRGRHHPDARKAAPPGMAWAEGTLWVGQHRNRKIHQVDPRDRGDSAHHRVRTASSRASPGSMANSGTAPGRASKANCGESIRRRGEVLEQLDMPAGNACLGAGIERRRHVLLRRRKQRETESRPSAHARLRSQTAEVSGMPQSARRALKNVGSWQIRRRQLRVNRVGFAMSAFMSALANCGHLGPPWAR